MTDSYRTESIEKFLEKFTPWLSEFDQRAANLHSFAGRPVTFFVPRVEPVGGAYVSRIRKLIVQHFGVNDAENLRMSFDEKVKSLGREYGLETIPSFHVVETLPLAAVQFTFGKRRIAATFSELELPASEMAYWDGNSSTAHPPRDGPYLRFETSKGGFYHGEKQFSFDIAQLDDKYFLASPLKIEPKNVGQGYLTEALALLCKSDK
jgi:hypothetical protein